MALLALELIEADRPDAMIWRRAITAAWSRMNTHNYRREQDERTPECQSKSLRRHAVDGGMPPAREPPAPRPAFEAGVGTGAGEV